MTLCRPVGGLFRLEGHQFEGVNLSGSRDKAPGKSFWLHPFLLATPFCKVLKGHFMFGGRRGKTGNLRNPISNTVAKTKLRQDKTKFTCYLIFNK